MFGKQSKGVPIAAHAQDAVGQLYRLREADRLADSPCATRPHRQRRACPCPRVTFARAVHCGGQMPGGRPPVIGREACEATGLQHRLALSQALLLPTAKASRPDGGWMRSARRPQPARPLVPRSFPSGLKVPRGARLGPGGAAGLSGGGSCCPHTPDTLRTTLGSCPPWYQSACPALPAAAPGCHWPASPSQSAPVR